MFALVLSTSSDSEMGPFIGTVPGGGGGGKVKKHSHFLLEPQSCSIYATRIETDKI